MMTRRHRNYLREKEREARRLSELSVELTPGVTVLWRTPDYEGPNLHSCRVEKVEGSVLFPTGFGQPLDLNRIEIVKILP